MSDIQIITDSTSDLSPELIEEHHIGVIPLHVVFGDRTYRDGVDMTAVELFAKVRETGMLPKTSAPSPVDFMNFFQSYIYDGKSLLYIGLSSGFSSTYQNAVLAASEFPEGRIEVVDSRNLSTGIGLLILKASDYIRQGENNLARLADRIRKDTARVETEFAIDTMEYLHKGGRCSGTQKVVGSLLRIHPVVQVKDGGMILAEKLRGKMDKVSEELLIRALAHKDRMEMDRIFVTHSKAEESALWLKANLEKELGTKNVHITNAGCVISSHCGPGTVGILFMRKEDPPAV